MVNRLENNYKDTSSAPIDYSKIKVGLKTLEDAVFSLGDIKKANPRYTDKGNVLQAIENNDFQSMRDISCFYYKTSGIYNRLCRYMAYMYRYDWFITPHIISESLKEDKILDLFYKVLFYLDNSNLKKFFGEAALKVLKNGCYYGYLIFQKNKFSIQELPIKYCRTRFSSSDGNPVIEFNMKFFDDYFRDSSQRARMLNLFPEEFKKGYRLYKQGKLIPTYQGDSSGWYLLDTNCAFKFNINGEDFPMFISVIPSLIDLDAAKDLDRKKMEQQLLKIVIQKMPIDKNGDLVFDPEESRDLHNTAVQMLKRAVGVDILTTFADTKVEDMSESNNSVAADQLERVERAVYNEAGVSQMQFNTDGNIALEKSVLNDEASLFNLIQQFEDFLDLVIKQFNKNNKKIFFKVQILPTTIYNYKELSKLYKEQTQLGYTKMLPQIALGQSQSSILANAYFENDILDLVNVFIPPMMSSTMSANALNGHVTTEKESGRPEKADDEKAEKTIQNKEAMS
jgi:hypothetical protein|nr:MAG TPA: portal protein [Caudoviricetes sp.]